MSLPHEEAARKEHPTARKFMPVHSRSLLKKKILLGWTFEIDRDGSSIDAYAWISWDHRITSDPSSMRDTSASLLRSYVRAQGTQRLGSVTASGRGSVAAGGDIRSEVRTDMRNTPFGND